MKNIGIKILEWKTNLIDKPQIELTNKDIDNTEQLAEILNDKDIGITITNILEWQDRNIGYWYERADMTTVLIGESITFVVIFCLLRYKLPTYLLGGIIGLIIGNIIYICSKYRHFTRKKGFVSGLPKILTMVRKTFKRDISIFDILNYRLAICRDYAKLTSAILHNLNIKHYFLFIFNHVAVAVEINNNYYVIDQKLPLCDIDTWLKKHNEKCINLYAPEDIFNSKLKFKMNYKMQEIKTKLTKKHLKKIETDVKKELNVCKTEEGMEELNYKTIFKNKMIKGYDYDKIIHYSLVMYIVNKIKDEFLNCGLIRDIRLAFDRGGYLIIKVGYIMGN